MADTIIIDIGASASLQLKHARAARAGLLRRIYTNIYTDDLKQPIEQVTSRNAMKIAAALVPGAVLSGRSALEFSPAKADDGRSFLFLSRPGAKRRINLPCFEIRVSDGPGPLEGDFPFLGLFAASDARRMLENLSPSRDRSGVLRTLGQEAVERLLDTKCTQEGEEHLNGIRDAARRLAPVLGCDEEFKLLDGIVGTLLGTRTTKLLTQVSRARAAGRPYDPDCRRRLELLRHHLSDVALPELPDTSITMESRAPLSFIESYFSNYIEGTRFPVRDAKRIIVDNWSPPQRPRDGRDVSSTYVQLMELGARAPSSTSYPELSDEIRSRHAQLMDARPDIGPGKFKVSANFAGGTVFVHPDLVEGTLKLGSDMLGDIEHPFARAAFLHFLLTDVHPFADGNGRLSRIMMTKELVSAGLSRLVIPNSYRDDYFGVLRLLSRSGNPAPFVRSLVFCQKATAAATARTIDEAIDVWAGMLAFQDPNDPDARFRMPDPAAEIIWKDGVPAPGYYWEGKDAAALPFRV